MNIIGKTILIMFSMFLFTSINFENKNKKIALLCIDLFLLVTMVIYLLLINSHSMIYLINNPLYPNVFLILMYKIIISIILIIIKENNKIKKIFSTSVIIFAILLCIYDQSNECTKYETLKNMPYLTLKDLTYDKTVLNNNLVYSNLVERRSIITKESYLSDEILPYISYEESSVLLISTEYYNLSSELFAEKLQKELIDDSSLFEWKTIDNNFFDEMYYRYFYFEDEKIVFMSYRFNNIVVHSEFAVDRDYDIENILYNKLFSDFYD